MIKDNFKKIAEPLQKVILKRLGYFCLIVIVTIFLILTTKDWVLCVPCFIMSMWFCISGLVLFNNGIKGKILCITGICTGIEHSMFNKIGKSISLSVDGKCVKLAFNRRIKEISEGCYISVYMHEKTKIYNDKFGLVIYDYYVLEVEKR